MYPDRVLSGMRPTGALHLGHYHGALKNWVRLQNEVECLFMVADWHALTTAYDDVSIIAKSTWEMVIDWLAAGVDPSQSTIFIQSRVPEHAELTMLMGMGTPLSWLERVPTYKDQIEKLSHKDLGTYGFLGYPLMQAADILVYRANQVPVGEDQVSHIELTREIPAASTTCTGGKWDLKKRPKPPSSRWAAKRPSSTTSCAPATSKAAMKKPWNRHAPCSPTRKTSASATASACSATWKGAAR